jgi:hypothetical protein
VVELEKVQLKSKALLSCSGNISLKKNSYIKHPEKVDTGKNTNDQFNRNAKRRKGPWTSSMLLPPT